MNSIYCCKLRTLSLWIGITFFLFQTAFLILFFYGMVDIKYHLTQVFDWFITEADIMGDREAREGFVDMKFAIVRRASDFLAIPITINLVLMISNSLLLWSTASKHKILLYPWLILHGIEWFCFVAVLIYFLIIMPRPYLKVILFLVVCPFLVVFAFCWFVIRCYYSYLRDLRLKQDVAAVYEGSEQKAQFQQPSTVYSTSTENHWDHPLPIWANAGRSQQSSVLDPALLQRMDPRYGGPRSYPSPPASFLGGGRHRRLKTPTRLADGTLVVPISDDPEDLTEIEEEEEGSQNTKTRSEAAESSSRPTVAQSVRVARSILSEDGTSVVSLSDKYRQQDEVEIFEEFYQMPPKPILPKESIKEEKEEDTD